MMSLSMYIFYNWFVFLWGSIGMIFIAVVSIKEMIAQLREVKQKRSLSNTAD